MPRKKPEPPVEEVKKAEEGAADTQAEAQAPTDDAPEMAVVDPGAESAEVDSPAPAEEAAPEPDNAPAETEEPTAEASESSEPTAEEIAEIREKYTREDIEAKVAELPDGPDKERAQDLLAKVYPEPAEEAPAPPPEQPVGQGAPDMASPTPPAEEAPVVKSGGKKVAVRAFFGSYRDVVFNEDPTKQWGVAEDVSDETLGALRKEYPEAEIEVAD